MTTRFIRCNCLILGPYLCNQCSTGTPTLFTCRHADIVPPSQHKVADAFFAFCTSIGSLSGSLIGSIRLSSYLPIFPEGLHALNIAAAAVLDYSNSCHSCIHQRNFYCLPEWSTNVICANSISYYHVPRTSV